MYDEQIFEDEFDMLDEDYEDAFLNEYDEEDDFDEEWESYDDESFFEDDLYEDFEGDPFWGKIKKWAKKGARKLGRVAKRHAGKIGTVVGGAFGGPLGAKIGGGIGNIVKNLEDEDGGYDSEDEMNAVMPISSGDEALAEAMAEAASKSRPSDAQARGGAIAITITSKAPMAVKTVAPGIAAATGRLAKQFATSRSSRPLNRTLASIVKDTSATLAKKGAKGKPVTPATAARVMTKQAKRTLRSQGKLAKALANNAAKKNKLRRAAASRAERFY